MKGNLASLSFCKLLKIVLTFFFLSKKLVIVSSISVFNIPFYFERKITSMLQMLQTLEYSGLSKQNTTVMIRGIFL